MVKKAKYRVQIEFELSGPELDTKKLEKVIKKDWYLQRGSMTLETASGWESYFGQKFRTTVKRLT